MMDIKKVDLNLLVVFDMLLRQHNVSRAAEALGMSQPATSYALNKLRNIFDDPLFIRAPRGLKPTPRAEQLAVPLQQVLDRIHNELLNQPDFDPATIKRTFTFNMADVGELVFLPKIRARLALLAPRADLRSVFTPPAQLVEAMESGEVDLTVGCFPHLQGANIYQKRLFSHRFKCIVRRDHPVIGDAISREQFLEAQHAVVRRDGVSHEIFEQALDELGLARRVVLSLPHYLAIPLIIAESDLVVTVPYAVAKTFARMADLKMLRPPIRVPPVDVRQFWHARFHHDPANIWLRQVIVDLFYQEPKGLHSNRTSATRADGGAGVMR